LSSKNRGYRNALRAKFPIFKGISTAMVAGSLTVLTISAPIPAVAADSVGLDPQVYIEEGLDLSLPKVTDGRATRDIWMSGCNALYAAVTPLGFGWSGEYRWLNCSYWGATATAKKYYSWHVSPNSSSQACAQGFGFRSGALPYWGSLSCGDSGSQAIDWGQVAAYPKIKVMSLSGLIVPIYWN